MPVKIAGLPAHVLLIHAVVVLLPLAAAMLVAGAVWPAARRKLGFLTPALALVVLALVPVTTHAGEWLKDRLPETKAIQKHAELGDTLLPWAVGIFVVAAAIWWLGRRYELSWRPSAAPDATDAPDAAAGPQQAPGGGGTTTLAKPTLSKPALQTLPVWVTAVAAVLAIGVSAGGVVQLYRIGDSGAKAVWSGVADLPVRGGSGGG